MYFRLTPVVVAIFIPVITIARYMGSGPMYQSFIVTERDNCLKNWWSFLLYVQNYVNYSNLVSYSNVNFYYFKSKVVPVLVFDAYLVPLGRLATISSVIASSYSRDTDDCKQKF